jgi:gamma-tubulin complex component 2
MKLILREFDVLLSQLEHNLIKGKLSLQKLIFLLQPSRTIIRVLANLCGHLDDCAGTGGMLLDVLHTHFREQGDTKVRDLFSTLLHKASEPFLLMLGQWIFR